MCDCILTIRLGKLYRCHDKCSVTGPMGVMQCYRKMRAPSINLSCDWLTDLASKNSSVFSGNCVSIEISIGKML